MERNICDILAQRMKGRKMSFKEKGDNNLAEILVLKERLAVSFTM
ncbi:hypothetical protein [Thermoanaerobacterium sp. RBIITD]|nr:hypothetical protein [Thermoanaerobacterium sp. RBIITD]